MSTHCGKALPQPIVTTATLTTIKFVSQTEDRSDSSNLAGAGQDETTGFKLKYKGETLDYNT